MTHKDDPFNLLDAPWIPVLRHDGTNDRVGILQALAEAHRIRTIAAPNPMDRVAILRFLLAVLMWCKESAKSCLVSLPDNCGIPEHWLDRLKDNREWFNLLGDGKRFYQDSALAATEPRPVADLLVEFPGEDSVNHMRHVVHDGSYGFCPACCAMGIVRLSVWAPANRFYPASVNPGSAAYLIVEGRNLVQTIIASLPDRNAEAHEAPWTAAEAPDEPNAVAMLAWRPRKLWLNTANRHGVCSNCGTTGPLITGLHSQAGWGTPTTGGQRLGNAVLSEFQKLSPEYISKTSDRRKMADKVVRAAPIILKCRRQALSKADARAEQAPDGESDAARIARIFEQLYAAGNDDTIKELTRKATKQEQPQLTREDTQQKKFWDDDPHLLRDGEAISLPGMAADVGEHASKLWRDALPQRGDRAGRATALGPVVNKFTFQDAHSVVLPVASDAVRTRAALTADLDSGIINMLKQVLPRKADCRPEIVAAVKLMKPHTEARIREGLGRLNDQTNDTEEACAGFLREVYGPVVDQALALITPGSPLRRLAVRRQGRKCLDGEIKALVRRPQPSANVTPTRHPDVGQQLSNTHGGKS